jgi:uncharacterized protein (TIGR02118 family)
MMKMVALFKKKAGMSREDFIHYYETKHVPLILEVLPDTFKDYRRNYILFDQMFFPDHMEGTPPPPPPFDMMTELWMESREKFDEMNAAMSDPVIGDRVAKDEANFLDRSSMVMFLVDERVSKI